MSFGIIVLLLISLIIIDEVRIHLQNLQKQKELEERSIRIQEERDRREEGLKKLKELEEKIEDMKKIEK